MIDVATIDEILAIGEMPSPGAIPRQMYAQVIRPERYGDPLTAFRPEVVPTPTRLRPGESLIYVMAAGINYNNVWASLGKPVDVIGARDRAHAKMDPTRRDPDYQSFHIGGSDASGIIVASANPQMVGKEVVVHCGTWDADDPVVEAGEDPMYGLTFKIWGYETNWGSFAQYAKVQDHQCLPKPRDLTWEEAAAPMLVGCTSYRMLMGWPEHTVKKGDVVLIWGGSGGLGCQAIQIVKHFGGIPVAVVSDNSKGEYCKTLGAAGFINRKDFDHWGMLPDTATPPDPDSPIYEKWAAGARAFGKAIWDIVGGRKNPKIVFEHPGQDTMATSIFVCDRGGMVVICAGTTGYKFTGDLRYLWMHQKRLQGSHFANDDNAAGYHKLLTSGAINPCMSEVVPFVDTGAIHDRMRKNQHREGNTVISIGCTSEPFVPSMD